MVDGHTVRKNGKGEDEFRNVVLFILFRNRNELSFLNAINSIFV